jgi:hypothetical protein
MQYLHLLMYMHDVCMYVCMYVCICMYGTSIIVLYTYIYYADLLYLLKYHKYKCFHLRHKARNFFLLLLGGLLCVQLAVGRGGRYRPTWSQNQNHPAARFLGLFAKEKIA